MLQTPHELAEEFPEDGLLLTTLTATDPHFADLSATLKAVNEQIFRIETEIEPASDDVLTDLRRHRLHLMDELAAAIAAKRRAVA